MNELSEIQEWLDWVRVNGAPKGLIIFLERTIKEVNEDLAAVEAEEYWKDELELPQ